MSTIRQETLHAVRHFFQCFLVIKYVNAWLPIKDFFRSIWWKAWGHDPRNEPEFHLGQMSFDDKFFQTSKLTGAVISIVEIIHGSGENDCYKSNAFWRWCRYRNFKYQKYANLEPILDICNSDRPGQMIIDWVCSADGFRADQFAYRVTTNPQFKETVDKVLALDFTPTPNEATTHEK